ncbi:MAG: hypothetical protein ACIAQU_01350 [Phycisphaerales bacterium JB064]
MATTCPCGATIEIDDINIAEGVALCRRCGKVSRLSAIASGDMVEHPRATGARSKKDAAEERKAAALAQGDPPAGCGLHDYGDRVVLRASARSMSSAAGLLFFCAFWNGIVSIFLVVLFSSIMAHMGVTLPAWFPSPMQSSGQGSSSNMPLGMTVFMGLFLTPFVLIGLAMFGALLVSVAGKVEVRLHGPDGVVFTGVGPFGWKRKFDADAVEAVRLTESDVEVNNRKQRAIAIETAKKTIKFGSGMPDQRRLWLGGVLKTMLGPAPGR